MDKPVALITGALTGIGRASAIAFAKKGANVVVAGRHDEAGRHLAEQLRSLGSQAEFTNADVRAEDDVRDLVDQTVARFGHLDVAVNNAGTEGSPSSITDQTAGTYAATFDTNVLGVILCMKHQVRAMQKQGGGSIVNVSSIYGHEGVAGGSIYAGSKHAVEGITKSVAIEVAEARIRVNAVAPGYIDTGMLARVVSAAGNSATGNSAAEDDASEFRATLVAQVPLGRIGRSEEVADAIVFLGSDQASYITGHVFNVDGGHSAN
jgi:NAD(P)-dependent dehydrogenase (short-subunit alcohol dehydrogenase family)